MLVNLIGGYTNTDDAIKSNNDIDTVKTAQKVASFIVAMEIKIVRSADAFGEFSPFFYMGENAWLSGEQKVEELQEINKYIKEFTI